MISRYTQMMWADSYLIGCGVAILPGARGVPKGIFNVCNYGPAGNMDGEAVYQTGSKAASACPSGTTANSATGLCV